MGAPLAEGAPRPDLGQLGWLARNRYESVGGAGSNVGNRAEQTRGVGVTGLGQDAFGRRMSKDVGRTHLEEALAQARSGTYDTKTVEPIPPDLRKKYLEPTNGDFAFRKDLRRLVIFGRHDLVSDAPISRVDLIVCRNTLMYFNAEAQGKIYNGFHFALTPAGYLFLGKSEMLLTRTDIFQPVDVKRRIFSRVPRGGEVEQAPPGKAPIAAEMFERLRLAAFESALIAHVVLDKSGVLVAANGRARSEFGLVESDIGRPFRELEISFRPTNLRSRIDRAFAERQSNIETGLSWISSSGEQRYLDVEVLPLFLDGEDIKAATEDGGEIPLPKKMVVVVPVDNPVARAPLARVVLEAGAENGQMEVAARLQQWRETVEVPGPIGLLYMMKDPAVHQCIKARLPKRETKGVGDDELQVRADRACVGARASLP